MYFFQVFKIIKIRNVGSNVGNSSWKTFRPFLSFSTWTRPLCLKRFFFCFKYWSSVGSVRHSCWNPDAGCHLEHLFSLHKGCIYGGSWGARHNCPHWDLWRRTVFQWLSLQLLLLESQQDTFGCCVFNSRVLLSKVLWKPFCSALFYFRLITEIIYWGFPSLSFMSVFLFLFVVLGSWVLSVVCARQEFDLGATP